MSDAHRIVIVGGGTAGWMTANLFVRQWPREQVRVTLIEAPGIPTIGVGEGSTPAMKRFFRLLDVADDVWMPACDATYKVGIRFDGWAGADGPASYRHPFFSQPDVFTSNAFLTNCRTRRLGLAVRTQPDDFFLNAALARHHAAPLPSPSFPFDIDYGYHFDASKLGAYLAELGVARGVEHIAARVDDVVVAEDGDIDAVVIDGGDSIGGDFFVDCTGFRGLLIQKTLGVEFSSFADNLFNDAAVALPSAAPATTPSETVSTALSAGWCWHIPLTSRFGNGYVYSSDFISADEAETELRRHVGDLDGNYEARHLKMRVGQLDEHWRRNCLAVGLAQGFIEPLEATALLLVQQTVETFIHRYSEAGFECRDQATFNAFMCERFERVREYIVAHYKLNGRDDSEYWRANRGNDAVPDALRHLLDAWYRRQDLGAEIERRKLVSHFDVRSWHCLLAGYDIFPPPADEQPGRGDHYDEKGVGRFVAGCAMNFKPQDAVLGRPSATPDTA